MSFELNIPSRIYDGQIDGNELMVYLYLKSLHMGLKFLGDVYMTNDLLLLYMYGSNPTRREKDFVAAAISRLQEVGYIKYSSIDKKLNIVDIKDKHFTIVPFDAIDKIMKSGENKRGELCLYLLQLMGTRDNSLGIGYQRLSYLSSITGLSERTIIRYNSKLESIGVIYVRRSNNINTVDGFTYSDNNVYGLFDDRQIVDKYADEQNYGADTHNANWQRSVTAKYNAYCRSSDKYSYSDMMDIYNMCVEYNALMDKLQEQYGGDDYIKKKKDMGVFNVINDDDLF